MPEERLADLRQGILGKQVDLTALLRRIVDDVTRRLLADRGTLYLVDHARQELVSHVAHLPEISEIRLRLGEGVAGWVAQSGELLSIPPNTNDPRFSGKIDAMTGYRTRSLLAVPVFGEADQVIAVLQLLNKRGNGFQRSDETLLAALASQVAGLLEITSLRSQLRPEHRHPLSFHFNEIIGESNPMLEVYEKTGRAAATEATVLIRGESGTGKELIARAIHDNSRRRLAPFVKIDCAALPDQLIENELFGHERGAFTGADRTSDGKLQAAAGGTLFLDEIGELPLPVQGKLLGLLQSKSFFKVGGTRKQTADVRFVCATHRNLEELVAEGQFRQDLYYRLRVVEIPLPPLRHRGHGDLERLIDHFMFELSQRHQRRDLRLSPAARALLHSHAWPGNVRELEHCIESAIVLAPEREIGPESVSFGALATTRNDPAKTFQTPLLPLKKVEQAYIEYVLEQCGGNRSAAARLLQIGRNTLARKLASPQS